MIPTWFKINSFSKLKPFRNFPEIMDVEPIFVGSSMIILAAIGFSANIAVLAAIIRHTRHSKLVQNKKTKKSSKDLSQYFLSSMWICFTMNLVLTIGHDGPSVIMDRPILGHTSAGVCGWFSRWVFYASAGHMILLAGNRYVILRKGTSIKNKIFGTKIGLRFSTFIIWAPAAAVATIIKLKACEFQFVAQSLAQVCIETITDQVGVNISSRLKYDDLRILLIVDSIILSIVCLSLFTFTWHIFWSLNKRQMRITQAASVLSMVEKPPKKNQNVLKRGDKTIVMVHERNQVRQLVIFSFAFVIHSICYLTIYWFNRNRWVYFSYTLFDIVYSSSCPLLYLILTNDFHHLIPFNKSNLDTTISETSSVYSWMVPTTSNGGGGNRRNLNEKSPFSEVYWSKTPSPVFSNVSSSHGEHLTFTSPMSLDVINLYQNHSQKNQMPVIFSSEFGDRSQTYEKPKIGKSRKMSIQQARSDSMEPKRRSVDSDIDASKVGTSLVGRYEESNFVRTGNKRLPPVTVDAFDRQISHDTKMRHELDKKRKRWLMTRVNTSVSMDTSSNDSVLSHLREVEHIRKSRMKKSETLSLNNCETDGSLNERFLENCTSLYVAKNSTFQTSLTALSESKCSSMCSVEDTNGRENDKNKTLFSNIVNKVEEYSTV